MCALTTENENIATIDMANLSENTALKKQIDATIPTTEDKNNDNDLSDNNASQLHSVALAVNLSLFINILLLISKAFVYALTFSFAVIASLVDSALDILSQIIIYWTDRKVRRPHDSKYPVGKTRLEPVGILTVCIVMVMLIVSVIRESVQELIEQTHTVTWSVIGVSLLACVILLKFILWLYCKQFKSNPIARALAQDHINDVVSNLMALIVVTISGYFAHLSWLDPAGAIVISLWIIWSWYKTGKEEVKKLVGRRASDESLAELKRICEKHHPNATLDVLLGYHIGRNILVEVEMMMAKETTLEITHDVCMELQHKIEKFEYVERAFVHCDYVHRGFDEHKQPTLQ